MENFQLALRDYYSEDFVVIVDDNLTIPNLDVNTQFILCPRKPGLRLQDYLD